MEKIIYLFLISLLLFFIAFTIYLKKIIRKNKFFMENSLNMFCIVDYNGYFKYVNELWNEILGWTEEEIKSKPYLEFIHVDDVGKTLEAAKKLKEGDNILSFENRYLTKEGKYKWLLWNSISDSKKKIIYAVVCDITEKKENELKLKKSEEKYRVLFENMTAAFALHEMIYNENGEPIDYVFLEVNPYFEKLTGIKKEEILGKNIKNVLPETEDYWIQAYGKTAKTGESLSYENYSKEINKYFDCWAFSPEKDKFAVFFIDVTKRKKIEIEKDKLYKELNDKNKKLIETLKGLEEAGKAKSQFLANMSHEIRTPLNGVIGMVEIMSLTPLSKEQKEYMNAIEYSANSLLDIINDILDLSKIESGKIDVENKDFYFEKMIASTMDMFSLRAHKKGLEFVYFIDNKVPEFIISDEGKIRQILINIIGNAIKFTEKGSIFLEVKLGYSENKKIELEFSVTDTGIGITDNKLKDIFMPFTQADSSFTKQYQGTGLGLAISKKLVEILGGEIKVESEINKGSKFIFNIVAGISDKTVDLGDDIVIENMRILLVDDNKLNREIVIKMLKKEDIKIVEAESGETAIKILENDAEFDIILLDVNMPDMSGIDTARYMKDKIKDLKTVIVMFTSVDIRDKINNIKEFGVGDYIIKPVKKYELMSKIKKNFIENNINVKKIIKKEEKSKKIVLIAEDNEVNQNVLKRYAILLGFDCITADNGEEAVEKYNQNKIDVVFMDIQMPVMNGLEAIKKIREINRDKVPIIVISAYAMQEEIDDFIKSGADGYLSKPISFDKFKNQVSKILEKNEIC